MVNSDSIGPRLRWDLPRFRSDSTVAGVRGHAVSSGSDRGFLLWLLQGVHRRPDASERLRLLLRPVGANGKISTALADRMTRTALTIVVPLHCAFTRASQPRWQQLSPVSCAGRRQCGRTPRFGRRQLHPRRTAHLARSEPARQGKRPDASQDARAHPWGRRAFRHRSSPCAKHLRSSRTRCLPRPNQRPCSCRSWRPDDQLFPTCSCPPLTEGPLTYTAAALVPTGARQNFSVANASSTRPPASSLGTIVRCSPARPPSKTSRTILRSLATGRRPHRARR